MVKNTKGGSGHKSQARKHENATKQSNFKTRFAEDEYEYYAQVVATLGNGMCHVMCKDGKKRLCIIRGKFRGRVKRDNIVTNGKWVLVGGRDFESERSGNGTEKGDKLEKCDLLEVYTDLDKERLKAIGGFNDFVSRDHTFANVASCDIEFSENANEEEYNQMIEQIQSGDKPNTNISLVTSTDDNSGDDEINIDDI
jgi:initiation factor 1A